MHNSDSAGSVSQIKRRAKQLVRITTDVSSGTSTGPTVADADKTPDKQDEPKAEWIKYVDGELRVVVKRDT